MQKWWTKKKTLRLPDFIILMVRPSVITLTLSKFNVSFVVHVCFLVGTSCWSITLMLLLFYRAMIFKGEISCWSFSLPCGPEFHFLRRVMTISFRLKTHVLSITSQVWTLFPVEWDGFNLYTFTKDDTYNKTLDPFQLCWLTGSPRTLQVISLRDHNLSLQCRRISGGRNSCLCSYCCSRHLWFYDSGRSGRVEIVTLRVGEKKIRLPDIIVLLGISIRWQTELLIGEV